MLSIFLYLGLIAKMNSDAQIYQEMGDVMLKDYYTESAEDALNIEMKLELEKMKEKDGGKGN